MKRKLTKQNVETIDSSYTEIAFTYDQWLVTVHDTGERFFAYNKATCLEYINKKIGCKVFTLKQVKLPVNL